MTIEDRLADVYDAAGAYLTALDEVASVFGGPGLIDAICRRDAALDELRQSRYPEDA